MRKLNPDWIEHYISDIEKTTEAPTRYHLWAGITVIAGALKRHVWIQRGKRKLFPNLYTVLVGPPGIGKNGSLQPALDILNAAGTSNVLSDRVTIQYCLEQIAKGFAVTTMSGGILSLAHDASCFISAPELAIFFRTSDDSLLSSLSDLWDCRDMASDYGTRSRGCFKIEKPCPTLIGGITPSQLNEAIPSKSISGGFTRRVNFIYESKNRAKIVWPTTDDPINNDFVDDLRQISTLTGEFDFSPSAKRLFEEYYTIDLSKEFEDEVTLNYNTTRWVQVCKVAMCLAVSRRDRLIIDRSEMEDAIGLIDECAVGLEKVFRTVGDSELAPVTDKVLRFIEMKGFAPRQMILNALYRDIGSTTTLDVVLGTLEAAHLIEAKNVGGTTLYKATKTATQQQPYKMKGVSVQ